MGQLDSNLPIRVSRSQRRLDELPARAARALKAAFEQIGKEFLRRLKTERLAGRPGLNKRSGELARSFQMTIGGDRLSDLALRVYSTSKYARLQEYGGTVKPVSAQYLAIPLAAALTGTGVARGGPRDYENTFVFKSKRGNLIIAQRLGLTKRGARKTRKFFRGGSAAAEKSDIVPLFVLKREVTVPPRLGMHALWADLREQRKAWFKSALAPVLRGTK